MNTLKELCAKYKKGDWPDRDSVHSYIDIYEEILAPYRETAKNVLEIGLMSGQSLRMLEEYFSGKVWGMDCSETPIDGMADLRPMIAEGGHNIIIGDATKAEDIQKHFKGIEFDILIDDGSHELQSQLTTFHLFKHKMAKGGCIIIEDIQSIDTDRNLFENIDPHYTVEIVDLRDKKMRYDDVLCIIKGF